VRISDLDGIEDWEALVAAIVHKTGLVGQPAEFFADIILAIRRLERWAQEVDPEGYKESTLLPVEQSQEEIDRFIRKVERRADPESLTFGTPEHAEGMRNLDQIRERGPGGPR
jgi:hypothetical protein